jgi:O-antigen/teichoic acid export membrane protein
MVHITSTIVALKTVTLILGGLITYFAFKAYRRTGSPPLRALALGFGAVTLGSLLAGVVDRLLETAGTSALVVESALTAVGFAIILYSLYAD